MREYLLCSSPNKQQTVNMSRTPATFSTKEFFASYKKNTTNAESKQIHKKVLEATGSLIAELIVTEGQVKMFGRLGVMMIRRVKPKGNPYITIDYTTWNRDGIKAYQFNDHSDGYIARILWNRKKCVLHDKHMWQFKPVRSFKRNVAKVMKNHLYEYPIINNL